MSKTQWKPPHYGVGAGMLILGLLAGRAFFPLEVPKPFVVEREKRIEVPVEKVVEKRVPFEVIKYVDRVVEKRVEVPVERMIEKRVEVPVERIVYRDRIVEKTVPSAPAGLRGWRQVAKGMTHQQIRAILGEPIRIQSSGGLEEWYFSADRYSSYVWFGSGDLVVSWSEPN